MVQLNLALREINCKIVYFGPGLSGKTTNLEIVHEKAPREAKGELTSIATESDRTLFFDFMPLNLGTIGGMKTKFQLYTVPGQVYYNSTRKLVLRGADGVVFVADSSPDKMEENIESLDNLEECLREQGRSLAETPHVIQFNKRDLPGAMAVDEMTKILNRHAAPCTEAVASKGEGVIETFKVLSGLVLDRVKGMSKDKPPARPASETGAPSARTPAVAGRVAEPTPPVARPVPEQTGSRRLEPAAAGAARTDSRAVTEPPARAVAVASPARSIAAATRTPISRQIAVDPKPAAGTPRAATPAKSRSTSTSQAMILSSMRPVRRRSGVLAWVMVGAAVITAAAFAWFKGMI
jgi:signal recognition particle receptor subunit beta